MPPLPSRDLVPTSLKLRACHASPFPSSFGPVRLMQNLFTARSGRGEQVEHSCSLGKARAGGDIRVETPQRQFSESLLSMPWRYIRPNQIRPPRPPEGLAIASDTVASDTVKRDFKRSQKGRHVSYRWPDTAGVSPGA
jgi:hypothetical protein